MEFILVGLVALGVIGYWILGYFASKDGWEK